MRQNFGTINQLAEKSDATQSWWIASPREAFTARALDELPRMRKSLGSKTGRPGAARLLDGSIAMNRTDAVLARLASGEWVDGLELARCAGAYAWRSRVSNARAIVKARGGDIVNRQRKVGRCTVSEYRLVPADPVQRDLQLGDVA